MNSWGHWEMIYQKFSMRQNPHNDEEPWHWFYLHLHSMHSVHSIIPLQWMHSSSMYRIILLQQMHSLHCSSMYSSTSSMHSIIPPPVGMHQHFYSPVRILDAPLTNWSREKSSETLLNFPPLWFHSLAFWLPKKLLVEW